MIGTGFVRSRCLQWHCKSRIQPCPPQIRSVSHHPQVRKDVRNRSAVSHRQESSISPIMSNFVPRADFEDLQSDVRALEKRIFTLCSFIARNCRLNDAPLPMTPHHQNLERVIRDVYSGKEESSPFAEPEPFPQRKEVAYSGWAPPSRPSQRGDVPPGFEDTPFPPPWPTRVLTDWEIAEAPFTSLSSGDALSDSSDSVKANCIVASEIGRSLVPTIDEEKEAASPKDAECGGNGEELGGFLETQEDWASVTAPPPGVLVLKPSPVCPAPRKRPKTYYVGGFPTSATKKELSQTLERLGNIKTMRFFQSDDGYRYAFVTFLNPVEGFESVLSAVERVYDFELGPFLVSIGRCRRNYTAR